MLLQPGICTYTESTYTNQRSEITRIALKDLDPATLRNR